MGKKTVVVSILGTRLDSAAPKNRWHKWRPSVAVCQQEDLVVDRYEILFPSSHHKLADVVQEDVGSVSPETDVRVHEVNFKDPWDFEEVLGTLHDFATSYPFNTNANDYLIHITTGSHVQQICLFLLTESRHLPGRLLQTGPPRGRGDTAVAGTSATIDLNLSRYDALAARFAKEQREGQAVLKSGIETRNPAFNTMIEQIERVAIASTAPMLLTGPTGAGKTRLARKIFEVKRLREQLAGEFVEVNCATLRGDQAMSALFGHTKGAFTGASAARAGLLKSADGGLLFLDEIGELGLDEQAMLLRAIEEKRFLPVGSDREASADFQLIAGTNRDLKVSVRNGEFREDLLARINLWAFELPSLQNRKEDIEPNVDFELNRASLELDQRISMTAEARKHFLGFATAATSSWSGNFRDLSAAVTRMSTLAENGRIGIEDVKEETSRLETQWSTAPTDSSPGNLTKLLSPAQMEKLDLFDLAQLESVIEICRQEPSMAAAGRRLFAVSRKSRSSTNDSDRLRKFLARFKLNWKTISAGAGKFER